MERITGGAVGPLAHQRAGAVTRTRAEEYRRLAQDCLMAARSASKEDVRSALTEQAAYYFRLAEQQDANTDSPPPTPVEDRPVVQQQQQDQPKEDKKE
jgi:hypothetical protein